MWIYEKKLMFPVNIKNANPKLAQIMLEQYGGSDGELGAGIRYLSQKFSMITPQAKAILNDVGTEEMAHTEMMGTIVRQLLKGATQQQIMDSGFDQYFVAHGLGVYPCSASGIPWSATGIQSKGDPITDLYEDMAAERKALQTYDDLIALTNDPDILKPLRFLREREIVHFQRFGEAKQTDLNKIYVHTYFLFFKIIDIKKYSPIIGEY